MSDPIPETEIRQDGEELWPTGTFRGPDSYEIGSDFDNGRWTLTGLAAEHVLFSASLLAVSGVNFDPVALYWDESKLPKSCAPYECVHDRIMLSGLPAPLNATIYACPQDYAPGLIAFLDRFSVRLGDGVYDSLKQKLPIVDWRLLGKTSVAPLKPPTVDALVYGLEGPSEVYYWRPVRNPWTDAVTLVKVPRSRKPDNGKAGSSWAKTFQRRK